MKNYIMVGVGGTGTHLLKPLYQYLLSFHKNDEWMLHLVDGDVVEPKNLERQLFAPGMVTMNKAQAAALSLADEAHVRAYPEYVSEENIGRFVQDGDTVLICADNFTVRARIESLARATDNVTIINGGNEKWDGSVQLWVREKGADVTPRIGYLHPEIAVAVGADRAEMTCQQAAALPGGEQTLIANLTSATWMLTALWRRHTNGHVLSKKQEPGPLTWTEVQFDALHGTVEHIDQRMSSHWRTA
jgi:ThiF family